MMCMLYCTHLYHCVRSSAAPRGNSFRNKLLVVLSQLLDGCFRADDGTSFFLCFTVAL